MSDDRRPEASDGIAIFPWGTVMEEWLDQIGLTPDDFVERMTTGWMFGYIAALRLAGWRPFIVYPSAGVVSPTRRIHAGTGAAVWLIPGRRIGRPKAPDLLALRQWWLAPTSVFRDVLTREGCGAILAQEYEFTRFDSLVRLGRKMHVPVLATFQGGNVTLSATERFVRRRSMLSCAGLIIPSSIESRRVERQYAGIHPTIYDIPNPVDLDAWSPVARSQARAELGLPQKSFIGINHGRIDFRQKANDRLVQAWPSGDDLLIVIGSGNDSEKFSALLRNSNSRQVRWVSQFSTDKKLLSLWLSAADVYVSASRLEGMPVAPLEAMACGLPVVATDANGVADIFPDGESSGGIVTPVDDADKLAAAIRRLRDDPELRIRMGLAARRRIEAHFSTETVAKSLAACLDGAIASARR